MSRFTSCLKKTGFCSAMLVSLLNQHYMSAAVEMCVSVFLSLQHGLSGKCQVAVTVVLELATPVAVSP